MAPPTYFLPHMRLDDLAPGRVWNRETLKARLLGDAFDDVADMTRATAHELKGSGPDKLPGCIVCAWNGSPPQRSMMYKPDQQDWQPVRDGSLLWIGLDRLEPVTPSDIRRTVQCSGAAITLSDGRPWTIPVYRGPFGRSTLPQDMYYDNADELRVEVKPKYSDRWDRSGEIWDILLGKAEDTFSPEWELDYATDALSVNYRYDRFLQRRLRLLDRQNVADVCQATLDYQIVLEWSDGVKKKEHQQADPRSNSLHGNGDSCQVTDRVAAS